ncbi:MAG: hypothetical protein AABW67_04530 [Nanoarchaeota archaeon]
MLKGRKLSLRVNEEENIEMPCAKVVSSKCKAYQTLIKMFRTQDISLANQNKYIPGEFYESLDPEFLEILSSTKIVPGELNKYGIASSLDSEISQEDLAHEELLLQLSGKYKY